MEAPTPNASASSTASAAPSAPASTVNDAAAALVFADSSLATPETPETPPADAVTPPVETPVQASTDPTVDDPRSPTIPRARFDEVNTRREKAEEALKQYEAIRDFQPAELQAATNLARSFRTNPVETALQILSELEADPQHAPLLRSHFARTLGARKAEAVPSDAPEPEADLQAPDGTLVYSAAQQAKREAWLEQRWMANVRKELDPLKQVAQTFQQERANAKAHTEVGAVLTKMRADPDFKANEAEIRAIVFSDPKLEALADRDPEQALEIAYARVFKAKVLPQRIKDSEGKTLANLQQRAVAAVSNPATASSATPRNTLGNARAALEYASTVTAGGSA